MFKPSTSLHPKQQNVLALLASGSTLQAAADQVGIHRNTVANWRRSDNAFRRAWAVMQYEQAMHWRDAANELAPLAIQTIRQVLTDEAASPSSRLRAALTIYGIASQAAPPQPELEPQSNTPSLLDWKHLLTVPTETNDYDNEEDEDEEDEDEEHEEDEEVEEDEEDTDSEIPEELSELDHPDTSAIQVVETGLSVQNSAKTRNSAQRRITCLDPLAPEQSKYEDRLSAVAPHPTDETSYLQRFG